MTTHVRQFSFQQGSELVKLVIEFSQNVEIGYWKVQFDYFTRHNQPDRYWYLGIIDQHLFCSYVSPCSVENLSKTLYRYLPPAQQPDIKAYLTELVRSGQIATLSPGVFLSQVLAKKLTHRLALEAALRMDILVDMDTYLRLGSGHAEFIQDNTLANDLPFKGSSAEELGKISLERQTKWQQVKRYLPSMNLVPVLNSEKLNQANLNDSQRQWIEQQVQRKLSLRRIAAGPGQDPMEVAKIFAKLVNAGIIQLVPPEQLVLPTIMVIDDSPLVLRQFQQWVKALGYSVILCQHAEQSINMIKQARPSLIFLDINMPSISGFDLMKQMRMIPKIAKIPVVILTAEHKLSNKWQARWTNCEFLTKPLSAEELKTFPTQLQTIIRNVLVAPPPALSAEADQ